MRNHFQEILSKLFILGSLAAAVVLLFSSVLTAAPLQAVNLKTQHAVNPLGIDLTQDGAPEGYTRCAVENAAYTLHGTCDVAFGANGSYRYLHGKTGTITFNLATFGGDPAPGVVKAGYVKSGSAGNNVHKREPVFPDSWPPRATMSCRPPIRLWFHPHRAARLPGGVMFGTAVLDSNQAVHLRCVSVRGLRWRSLCDPNLITRKPLQTRGSRLGAVGA